MRKIFSIVMFAFTTMYLIGQNQDTLNVKIDFQFNNYRVCDLSKNFEIYLFFVDTNNCYKIEKALTIENNAKINNSNFVNSKFLYIIFKYKDYKLIFNCSMDFFKNNFKDITRLEIDIYKRNCYKKYIRKSYSQSYKNGKRKLNNMEYDVSCNGLVEEDGTPFIDVFDVRYRKNVNYHLKDINKESYRKYRKEENFKFEGSVEICYSIEVRHAVAYAYNSYKKYFIQNELLFQELLSMNGMRCDVSRPKIGLQKRKNMPPL